MCVDLETLPLGSNKPLREQFLRIARILHYWIRVRPCSRSWSSPVFGPGPGPSPSPGRGPFPGSGPGPGPAPGLSSGPGPGPGLSPGPGICPGPSPGPGPGPRPGTTQCHHSYLHWTSILFTIYQHVVACSRKSLPRGYFMGAKMLVWFHMGPKYR